MNNTTVSVVISSDLLFALLKNSSIITQLYLWGYLIIFLFGFIGNVASLLTFSRPTLRNISTGCLFIVLAISDIVYLLVSIIDFVEFGLQIQIYRKVGYDELCRFRSFVFYVAQLCSAWILVFISMDRWIRTRFPYKAIVLCTSKKALLLVAISLVINIGLNSHMLTQLYGIFIPGLASVACGPHLFSDTGYSTWYFAQWSTLQVFINCLIPGILMILMLCDIIFNIRNRRQAAFNQAQRTDMKTRNLQKQIFILLMSRIAIFLATTLPTSLSRIITSRQVTFPVIRYTVLDTIAILTWTLSLNYTVNFYLHCLTSKLFRDEFIEQMKNICCCRQRARVTAAIHTQTIHRLQNQRY